MRAKLFCRTGELAPLDCEIDQTATIGRGPENTLKVSASVVSQAHARIFYDPDQKAFILEDLQSRNGTRLDGVSVRGPRRLGHVHVVTLGELHDFIFVASPPTAKSAAQADREVGPPPASTSPPFAPPGVTASVPAGDYAPVAPGETMLDLPSAIELPPLEAADGGVAASEVTVLELPSALELPAFEMGSGDDATPASSAAGSDHGGRVVLQFTMADGATRQVRLGEGRHEIGRSVQCAVTIDDRTLTRRHAVLTVTSDTVTLKDQNSQNGTFKGGDRLTGPVFLQTGDIVRFGDQVTLTVLES